VLGWQPQYPDLAAIIGSAWKWHSRQSYAAVNL
jgi:UDP-glucose 4-epimerase